MEQLCAFATQKKAASVLTGKSRGASPFLVVLLAEGFLQRESLLPVLLFKKILEKRSL